jgi:hypothetical protein
MCEKKKTRFGLCPAQRCYRCMFPSSAMLSRRPSQSPSFAQRCYRCPPSDVIAASAQRFLRCPAMYRCVCPAISSLSSDVSLRLPIFFAVQRCIRCVGRFLRCPAMYSLRPFIKLYVIVPQPFCSCRGCLLRAAGGSCGPPRGGGGTTVTLRGGTTRAVGCALPRPLMDGSSTWCGAKLQIWSHRRRQNVDACTEGVLHPRSVTPEASPPKRHPRRCMTV